MTTAEQIPAMDARLAQIDAAINRHIKAKFKLQELFKRVNRMLDYRDRRIRELGAERSRVATFTLNLDA